jgi:hypothetical protein
MAKAKVTTTKGDKTMIVTPHNSIALEDFKFGVELKTISTENIFFHEKSLIVTLYGNKPSIKSGIFKAMVSDKEFAKIICDAADYYKSQTK